MPHPFFFVRTSSNGTPANGTPARGVLVSSRSVARRAALLGWLGAAALGAWALGGLAVPGRAQNANSSRGAGYLLGPGDVLSLSVAGYPEYNQASIPVPPDGSVTLPSLGTIRISGRTRLAVQNEVRATLVRRVGMRNPSVALSITTFRPLGRVTLVGDVPRQGSFEVRPGERLSGLLADAGVGERLEEKSATLVRDGRRIRLDLRGASQAPGSATDLSLRAGDSIAVRTLTSGTVRISGDVARPGIYELHLAPRGDFELGASPRLSDLLAKAGWSRGGGAPAKTGVGALDVAAPAAPGVGSGPEPAWTGTVQRGGQVLSIQPVAALDRIGGGQDIRLRPGDFVQVAQVPPITVYLDGLVSRPAVYSVAPGTGVLELLTQAGGLTRPADEIIARVQRGNEALPLDLKALMFSGDSSSNLSLQNGDIVQLRAPETLDVLVAGQVTRPGTVQLKPGAAIFEAINSAGGIVGTPEDVRLSVLRKDPDGSQRILNADARAILDATDLSTNFPLQRGDVINVARNAAQTVFITGEVVNTGQFTLREGEGLTQLFTRAGGLKDDAALTKINVTRRGQVLPVDAYDAVRHGTPLGFTLQDGDQVLVQKNPNQVAVVEAVAKPGTYTIPEHGQLTLVDVLAQAAPVVGTTQVYVVHARPDGTFDTKDAPAIKINDLNRGRVPNVILQPHDVVFVPSPKSRHSFLDTLGQLSVFRLFF